jgi:hypothetical protein
LRKLFERFAVRELDGGCVSERLSLSMRIQSLVVKGIPARLFKLDLEFK